ncbi:MAG: hypothetical protein AAGF85_19795, partial [Bacteroidota bacterium]
MKKEKSGLSILRNFSLNTFGNFKIKDRAGINIVKATFRKIEAYNLRLIHDLLNKWFNLPFIEKNKMMRLSLILMLSLAYITG